MHLLQLKTVTRYGKIIIKLQKLKIAFSMNCSQFFHFHKLISKSNCFIVCFVDEQKL